jgi:phosphoribosylglycinamide formyltransferase-1
MSDRELRFGMVVSTAGSVMNEVLKDPFFRARVRLIVLQQPGPALEKARAHGIPTAIIEEGDNDQFCRKLVALFEEEAIDYVFSFYTKFYSAEFRAAFVDRILNFHPSLLPAFKGMDGFGDTVRHHARFAGNTVELIADVMDEGKIVMQTVCAVDRNAPIERTRHRVFVHQCQALLQSARWLQQGRIMVEGHRVEVRDATFDGGPFSPALDCQSVAEWSPPDPYSSPQ